MEHIIEFEAGHDCIKFECRFDTKGCKPGAGGSHGIHGLNIRFISKGEAGAVQFLLYTGWMPQYAERDSIGCRTLDFEKGKTFAPMPADLGYHSKKPMYEGQEPIDKSCEYCDGEPCYYDGSGLNATHAMYALVNGGDEALWKYLDEYYECTFNDGAFPVPTEYPKPLRNKS